MSYPSGFYAQSNELPPPPPPPPPPRTAMMLQGAPQPYLYNSQHNAPRSPPRAARHHPPTPPPPPSPRGQPQQPPPSSPRRPPPPPSELPPMFICRACHNLQLDSAAALEAHVRSHVACPECPHFAASPRIVQAHCNVVHSPNYNQSSSESAFKTVTVSVKGSRLQRFRICVGNRPEDIQMWIAERRKRFPRQPAKQSSSSAATKITATSTTTTPNSTKAQHHAADLDGPTTTAATGLSTLLQGYGSSSSDDESEHDDEDGRNEERPTVIAAEDDAEDDSTTASTMKAADPSAAHAPYYRTRPCRFFRRNGNCRNGEHCNFSHELPTARPDDGSNHKRQKTNSTARAPSSLLHKLLANDARREATLTIQLLEYLADSDFLLKPQQPPTADES